MLHELVNNARATGHCASCGVAWPEATSCATEAEAALIEDQGARQSPLFQVRVDLARARAWRVLGRPELARPIVAAALETAEAHGHRFFQLIGHHEAALVAENDVERARHERHAKSISASLAGNLPREDQARFLAQPWDKPVA